MVVNTLNIINSQKIMRPNYLLIFIFYHTTRVISTYSKAFIKASLKSDGRIFKVLKICCLTSSVQFSSVQFGSGAQLCPTPCDLMNRSTPGLPVHHQLPEFPQTHVHRVSDAIQPSHPLSSASPPAPNPSQHQSLFQ